MIVKGEPRIDYAAALKRREDVVAGLRSGVRTLLRQGKVEVLAGRASFVGPRTLVVEPVEADIGAGKGVVLGAQETVEAAHIMVATGSKPAALPIPGVDHPRVIDSDGALALTKVPASLLVAGAGAVGCEWSLIFARLGAKVTLVEMLPEVLPREDADMGKVLAKALKGEGVTVHTGTSVTAVREKGGELEVELSGQSTSIVAADYVLVAAGRAPLIDGLALEAAGVATDPKGWILDRPLSEDQRPVGSCRRGRHRSGASCPRSLEAGDRGGGEAGRAFSGAGPR